MVFGIFFWGPCLEHRALGKYKDPSLAGMSTHGMSSMLEGGYNWYLGDPGRDN